jgi:hypothetical protein
MSTPHTFLTQDGLVTKDLTRGKSIRAKCLECCCWQSAEVRHCKSEDCALWIFRMGYVMKVGKGIPETTEHAADLED